MSFQPLSVCLLNVKSVVCKFLLVCDFFAEKNINLFALTETLLTTRLIT